MKRLILLLMLTLSGILSGCAIYDVEAHGRFDNHARYSADLNLSWGEGNYYYDPFYGVYLSYSHPGSYWSGGYYYYFSGNHWMRSNHWHGPWLSVAPRAIPSSVHSFRSYVHAHPQRFSRVKKLKPSRYEHYRDRSDGRLNRDGDRYSRRYSSEPQRRSQAHSSSTYRRDSERHQDRGDGGKKSHSPAGEHGKSLHSSNDRRSKPFARNYDKSTSHAKSAPVKQAKPRQDKAREVAAHRIHQQEQRQAKKLSKTVRNGEGPTRNRD